MHINDIEDAAALVRLINLLDGPDWFSVRTVMGEVHLNKRLSGSFTGAIKRLAYGELDRMGVERPSVTPENAKY